MFKRRLPLIFLTVLAMDLWAWSSPHSEANLDMDFGKPEFQSVGALAFGPDGVLFVGDSKGAAVFAIDVDDQATFGWADRINIRNVDEQIASLLGTSAKEIIVHDLAVHPTSHQIYMTVSRGRGADAMPVIVRVTTESRVEEVSIANVRFSRATIKSVPAPDAKDRRGRSLRTQSITDLGFADGYLYVAGLSNEEFASQLRRIPFPFTDKSMASSLEIYHVAHGRLKPTPPYGLSCHIKSVRSSTSWPLIPARRW
ncbi:hypothetical protein MJD09_12455 [bacterium]|nr:hypothetical protein [bacterium]